MRRNERTEGVVADGDERGEGVTSAVSAHISTPLADPDHLLAAGDDEG